MMLMLFSSTELVNLLCTQTLLYPHCLRLARVTADDDLLLSNEVRNLEFVSLRQTQYRCNYSANSYRAAKLPLNHNKNHVDILPARNFKEKGINRKSLIYLIFNASFFCQTLRRILELDFLSIMVNFVADQLIVRTHASPYWQHLSFACCNPHFWPPFWEKGLFSVGRTTTSNGRVSGEGGDW